jgi:hypothetical protein
MRDKASYEEMTRSWSLDDVMKANALLDMQDALDKLEEDRLAKGRGQ